MIRLINTIINFLKKKNFWMLAYIHNNYIHNIYFKGLVHFQLSISW